MDLSEKILKMAEIMDTESISRAVEIPVDVVEGFLSGEINPEILQNYDINRKTEIRVVEKKRFISSKTIGVISPGGSGGSTFASALAYLLAGKVEGEVALLDLNSISLEPVILGIDEEEYLEYINLERDIRFKTIDKSHKDLDNLHICIRQINSIGEDKISDIEDIRVVKNLHNYTIVDIPFNIDKIEEISLEIDILFIVLKQNYNSIFILKNIGDILRKQIIMNKTIIVPNFGECSGKGMFEPGIKDIDFKREIKLFLDTKIYNSLPFERDMEKSILEGEIFFEDEKAEYNKRIAEIIEKINPTSMKEEEQKSKGILGRIRRNIWGH